MRRSNPGKMEEKVPSPREGRRNKSDKKAKPSNSDNSHSQNLRGFSFFKKVQPEK
jgi:hypothetical protein